MLPPPTLCLMLKAPHPGAVKTRLAASIGEEAAAAVYRRLVEHQAAQIPREWRVEVHFTPAEARDEMRGWLAPLLPPEASFHPQSAGDLGARLRSAAAGASSRGAREILFVGGDCPQLTSVRLLEAASALRAADFVIIPAHDGGYVLIGLTGARAFVFDDIAWSTSSVREQTERNIAARGLSAAVFASLEDVDDLESLRRARPHCPALDFPALRECGDGFSAPLTGS